LTTARRRRRMASGRKRAMKAMTKKNVSIAEEKDTHRTSVRCWARISPNGWNGLIQKILLQERERSV
jgi:hypothetical protein